MARVVITLTDKLAGLPGAGGVDVSFTSTPDLPADDADPTPAQQAGALAYNALAAAGTLGDALAAAAKPSDGDGTIDAEPTTEPRRPNREERRARK